MPGIRMFVLGSLLLATPAWAKLPAPTPAASQAAAAKKAKEDAQAAKDKQALSTTEDYIVTRWHQRAASMGWTVNTPAAGAPAGAAAKPSAAPIQGPSEKAGTAPPSPDEKENTRPNPIK